MSKNDDLLEFDEIGIWSEVKLAILEEYAKPFNEIILKKKLHPIYIDAFAGAGHHIAKDSGEMVKGSPVRALGIKPPFEFLHFFDTNETRIAELKRLSSDHPNVRVHSGDANVILPRDVFPTVRYDEYKRGLCILDPYGLDLDWKVIQAAGDSKSIEIFLNFPVMDINRNVLRHDREKVTALQRERLNRYWGDDSWDKAAYSGAGHLWGELEKTTNDEVAEAFRNRLKKVAGFASVPAPMPMRNSTGVIVYYLFFATQKPVAESIVKDIFEKFGHVGEN
jgi:three-Cys-motif partner protein